MRVEAWILLVLGCGCAGENGGPTKDTNQLPRALILSPGRDTMVTPGSAIGFRGQGTDDDGTVVEHRWDFGDSTVAMGEAPPGHRYDNEGTFVVSYVVVDDSGSLSIPAGRIITVQTAPPPADNNYALRFFGNGVNDIDRVKIRIDDPATVASGPPVDVGATDFTIEFWLKALPGENNSPGACSDSPPDWITGNIVVDRDRFGQPRKYGISLMRGRVAFGVTTVNSGTTLCGATAVDDGQWHHLAFTRTFATGALRIFVDGTLDGERTSGPTGDISYPDDGVPGNFCGGPCVNSDPFIVLAAEKHDDDPPSFPSFSGWLDELRFSTSIRYSAGFTPPTRRFTTDGATVGLYHFDEGAGAQVLDSSGAPGGPSDGVRRFGGSPAGPLWVLSSAPTGN